MTINWKRRLIPKWRVSTEAPIVFGADTRVKAGAEFLGQDRAIEAFRGAMADFQSDRSVGTAADAMRFAADNKFRKQLAPVAEFLTNQADTDVPSRLISVAADVFAGRPYEASLLVEDPTKAVASLEELRSAQGAKVRALRAFLKEYPNNSLAWMDLGRLRASLGDNEQAKRCIQSSLVLARDSRVVLRSAVRFYAHINDFDKAHKLLLRSERTAHDTWLMASEIAISSLNKKPSRHLRRAKGILASDRLAAADIAELAGAVAAEEIASGGNRKLAKQLYAKSLIAPNDNALAQAEWAARDLGLESIIDASWLDSPASAEAALYQALRDGNVPRAIEKALRWHVDEPWAARPMLAASFIATVQGEFELSTKYAQAGLSLNGENLDLLNNLVFSLASEGKLEAATNHLREVIRIEGKRLAPHTLANIGFVAYLEGETDLGARFYREAITRLERSSQQESAAMARICQAMAAQRVGDLAAEHLRREAKLAAKNSKNLLVMQADETLIGSGQPSTTLPAPRPPQVARWIYDKKENLLTLK